MAKKITEEARALFKYEYNLSYSDIGSKKLYKLHQFLSIELKNHDIEPHRIVMLPIEIRQNYIAFKDDGSIKHAFLRCKGSHFDEREAISFNSNDFIGFAGWSDDTNIVPFVEAFKKWLKWIRGQE